MGKKLQNKNNRGQISLQVLIFGAIAVVLLSGFLMWADATVKHMIRYSENAQAFQIAEAGIEYYRWHLAHAPQDFTDGTGRPGPYIHNYYDRNGNKLGQFILDITPPITGSTVVTITSTGRVISDPSIERIIRVKMGIPSYAKYAAVLNTDVRFGANTEVFGAIHSNRGIRFDGIAHNIVSSAQSNYDDPDHTGGNEFAVHTHVNIPPATGINDTFRPLEAPPNPVMNRNDVFLAGRQFPVPAVDFTGITLNLSQIRTDAQANGVYLGSSGEMGYHIVLKTNNTFDLYRVITVESPPSHCTNVLNQQNWGTWSIRTKQFINNRAFPANNLIFVEDDVWIDGQINNARLTVGAAIFPDNPSRRATITVNNNLLYTNYDGKDAIALIAQGNFKVGMISANTLRIDAALIAQNGRVGRYYYRNASGGQNRCAPFAIRQEITLYGMLMSNERYGFAYTDGTGYLKRNIIYDSNLLYGPPPSFPLISSTYQVISWEKIK